MDLGTEIIVEESKNLQVLRTPALQGKVKQTVDDSSGRLLCTRAQTAQYRATRQYNPAPYLYAVYWLSDKCSYYIPIVEVPLFMCFIGRECIT